MSGLTTLFSVILLVFSAYGQAGATDCPDGYSGHNFNCYVMLPVRASYAEAQTLCQAVGANLAVIGDKDEETFVDGMLDRLHDTIKTGQVWIGGTDLLQEGVFVEPVSLEPLTYFHWAPGEPDNLGGQHCLGLFKDNNWLWDDNGCEVKNFPFCKRPCFHIGTVYSTEHYKLDNMIGSGAECLENIVKKEGMFVTSTMFLFLYVF